ncbi:hypothetical protein BDQ12DRAFT_189240 [Crucibulum laeve]|uniref:Zn(2)-C6 fungal-type domain-containing protein n=1 Tax=Crucibulum laeve TaxID=68775 RepID=A0A5C3MG76_9AGAR|nr:hypothetical protein BDQ12DRAFT_189240 [Crucibulum laeve]
MSASLSSPPTHSFSCAIATKQSIVLDESPLPAFGVQMPATESATHHLQPRRTTSRKLTNDEEIDLRRARGEISCAECRRLKLKCDKKLPCSSCGK